MPLLEREEGGDVVIDEGMGRVGCWRGASGSERRRRSCESPKCEPRKRCCAFRWVRVVGGDVCATE